MKRLRMFLLLLYAMSVRAEVVHVTYQAFVDGAASTIVETTLETGCEYITVPAPAKGGYLFTHWSSSEADPLIVHDVWGRALDSARFTLYQDVVLTAHYVPASLDTDNDGIPDGWEYYWYGNLGQNATSDTDGDGYTFAQELATGTNPLFPDSSEAGGFGRVFSETFLYNPHNYAPVIMRSDPEGQFFVSTTNYCSAGDLQRSPLLSVNNGFTVWTVNGVEQRDAFGRALDQVVVEPNTSEIIEVVAHYVADTATRQSLYWYGNTTTAMDSDTDGDGYTFAEEIANGTNPLFPNTTEAGGVGHALSETLLYNPHNYAPYVVRSEPEGVLFETTTNYVSAGDIQRTDVLQVADGFAYWTIDGVEQRDAFGRALDQAVVVPDSTRILDVVAHIVTDATTRQSLYWYGRDDVAMDSDTDGDGYTFAEEIANGTNPLFPDTREPGGVSWMDSETLEANLQPFDAATGAVVDEQFDEIFTSPFAENAATSATFGANTRPVIVDVDGDGNFDLVVLYDGGYVIYLNKGTSGNPMFTHAEGVSTNGLDLTQGSLTVLEGLTLDTSPTDAVSCAFGDVDKDGVTDLLVSDVKGRIWYYKGMGENTYTLQHKVWGGSHAGFAPRLTIALVDWDGDGDLDCVCGTADGKLMLLVDPQIGLPTNVQAIAGVDSVVLTWDPNGNSRVRGYGIYRGVDTSDYDCIESLCPLPRYRDRPEVVQAYYYRITSLSRFYIAGNSTPTVYESMPTDAVYVQFRPSVWLNDTSGFTGSNVTVIVSMNNSMGISAEGLSMTFTYDSEVLEPYGIRTTGLTESLVSSVSVGSETETFSSQGGEIATGAGRFLLLDFKIKDVHDITSTTVSLTEATMKALDGRSISLDLPQTATIEISDSNPIVPAIVAVSVDNASVESETEFELPVTITTTEKLTNFTATVTWNAELLELKGLVGAGTLTIADGTAVLTTVGDDFALKFYAKDPESATTDFSAQVSLKEVAALDCHGFEVLADDATGIVLVHNAHPWVPARVSISTESQKVDTLEEVAVPFKVTTDVALVQGKYRIEWDSEVLELKAVTGGRLSEVVQTEGSAVVENEGGDFTLAFLALDQHTVTMSQINLAEATVKDAHRFTVAPSVPVIATLLIHDAHPLIPAQVTMTLGDVQASTETEFEMELAILTTETLTSLEMSLDYDTSLLELKSGVLNYEGNVPEKVVLRFYAKENHTVNSTVVTITPVSGVDKNGLTAVLPEKVEGTVVLADSNPWVPATVSVGMESVKVDTLTEFEVPVAITSNETLTNFIATVEWDDTVLEYRGETPIHFKENVPSAFKLPFYAKDQHDITRTNVRLVDISAVDEHRLTANSIADSLGVVLINDSKPLVPAGVVVNVSPVYTDTLSEFTVQIPVTSTKVLTNLTFTIGWDANLLEFRSAVGGATVVGTPSANAATITVKGTVPSTLYLTFYAKDQHTATQTTMTLSKASAYCIDGLAAKMTLVDGTVYLTDSNVPEPVELLARIGGAKGQSGQSFTAGVAVNTSGDLASLTIDIEWDASLLSFKDAPSAQKVTVLAGNKRRLVFACAGNYNQVYFNLVAKTITSLQGTSWIRLNAVSGVGKNGLGAVNNKQTFPLTGTVVIVREIGKYDPGDVDGDGAYTMADYTILRGYISYLTKQKKGAAFATTFANGYQKQYGVDVRLTGDAARAADVNGDGVVNSSDLSMLSMLIKEAEGAGQ